MTQLAHGTSFNLADALTSEVEVFANLFEGARFAPIQTETELEDFTLTIIEGCEQTVDLVGQQRRSGNLERALGRSIFDDVTKFGVAIFTKRFAQRQRLGCEAQRFGNLVFGHFHLGRQLRQRGRAPQLELQPGASLLQTSERVAGVHWQADGAARVRNTAGDGLADPPGCVGGELEALAPVELLDRVHEAKVAFLDEVEQRETRRLVLLCDGHHETKVGLHERALRVFTLTSLPAKLAFLGRRDVFATLFEGRSCSGTRLDGFGQSNFIIFGQQRVLANVGQIKTDKVLFIALDALLRQDRLLVITPWRSRRRGDARHTGFTHDKGSVKPSNRPISEPF